MQDDVYTCPLTGFSVRRPDGWAFVPGAWAVADRRAGAGAAGTERRRLLDAGGTPIAVLTRAHGSARHVDPTVQLFRRFFAAPADLQELGRTVQASLPKVLDRCRFQELTTSAILGGRRALRYLVDYSIVTAPGIAFRCRCLGHIITCGPYALTLTLASSTAKRYRFDDDLRAVLASASFRAPTHGGADGWTS